MFTSNDSLDSIMGAALVLLAVASLFLMPRLVRWMQIRRIDSMIKRHPKPELLVGPRSASFGEDSLQMQIGNKASSFDWGDSQGWVELDEHYLIFVKANVALVVPKRAFTYGSEEQSFLEFLRQKLGAARHVEPSK
ncbi:MAG: YcxB family protein [Bacteroidota bacterium]